MDEAEKITLVSCIVIDEYNSIGHATTYVTSDETVEDCIKQVKNDAVQDWSDQGGSGLAMRLIVNVTTIPAPRVEDMPHIEIRGETDDKSSAPVTVTSEVS